MVATRGSTSSRPRLGPELWLALAVLALSAPFLREWTAQPASRYLVAVAVVEDHTLRLDPYEPSLGLDRAEVDGHVYSDKAPYQPLASVPLYAAYRAAGGSPFPPGLPGGAVADRADAGVWWVTFWSCAVPGALLAALMFRYTKRFGQAHAAAASAALALGTVLLPFSSLLFGHVLAGLTGFAAWVLLRRDEPGAGALFAAGLLLGLGIGVEYPQIVTAVVLGVYALASLRARALWAAVGGAVGLVPLLVFNWLVFGGPFTTAYQGHLPNFQGEGAFGVYNLQPPDLRQLGLALFGDRGLLALTPIVIVAIVGCVIVIRAGDRRRADGVVALVLLAAYLLVSTGVDGYGGSVPGPRYLVPIVPFFVLPLAVGWSRWPWPAAVAAVWSAFWMVAASLTDPFYSLGGHARADWLDDLLHLRLERSIPGEVVGDASVLVFVVVAVACVAQAIRAERTEPPAPRSEVTPGATRRLPGPGLLAVRRRQ